MCHDFLMFAVGYIRNFFIPAIPAILALATLKGGRATCASRDYGRSVRPAAGRRLIHHRHGQSNNQIFWKSFCVVPDPGLAGREPVTLARC